MPILFLAWANLHMLFVVGLGLLGVYVALAVWESRRAGRAIPVDLLLIFGVSAVATLATPYGWRSYWFVLENARLDNTGQRINELKPLWTALGEPGAGIHFLMLGIWAVPCGWMLWRGGRDGRLPLWRWSFVIALIALALIQRRQVALAVPGVTMLAFSGWADPPANRLWRSNAKSLLLMIIPALLLAGQTAMYSAAGFLPSPWKTMTHGQHGIDCDWYPCEAVDYLKDNPPPERLIHDLYTGSFLAYQLAPETRVFIDGRLEVYNNGAYDAFFAPPEGRMTLNQLLDKYDVQSALFDWRAAGTQPNHTAALLSRDPQWQLCWFSDHYALFVKGNDSTRDYIEAHGYDYLNPLMPQRFMDALDNSATAGAAREEARRAHRESPGSHLAQKALEVSGQATPAP